MGRRRQAPITRKGGRLIERCSARGADLEGDRPLESPLLAVLSTTDDNCNHRRHCGVTATVVDCSFASRAEARTMIVEDFLHFAREYVKEMFAKRDVCC